MLKTIYFKQPFPPLILLAALSPGLLQSTSSAWVPTSTTVTAVPYALVPKDRRDMMLAFHMAAVATSCSDPAPIDTTASHNKPHLPAWPS